MKIWVDADACPKVIKEILFRAADKRKIQVTLLANSYMWVPPSPYIDFLKVDAGFDEADKQIVQKLSGGDLVITADIPLAAEVIKKDAYALNPRGELYTEDNVQARLSMRNFLDELRSNGVDTGGPAEFSLKNRQNFANQLDRFLTQRA